MAQNHSTPMTPKWKNQKKAASARMGWYLPSTWSKISGEWPRLAVLDIRVRKSALLQSHVLSHAEAISDDSRLHLRQSPAHVSHRLSPAVCSLWHVLEDYIRADQGAPLLGRIS